MQIVLWQPASVESRGDSYRPVPVDDRSSVGGEGLLLAAYIVIWLVAFAMIVLTMRRQRRMDARLEELGAELDRVDDARAPRPKKASKRTRAAKDKRPL